MESAWSTTDIFEIDARILLELEIDPVERTASDLYEGYLVELAQEGEVLPIDISPPFGGFGGVDLWIATVVPAVAAVQGLREAGRLNGATLAATLSEIVRRVRSPRARREQLRLLAAFRKVFAVA